MPIDLPPALTKKIGPAPVYVYAIGGVALAGFLYLRKRNSAPADTTSAGPELAYAPASAGVTPSAGGSGGIAVGPAGPAGTPGIVGPAGPAGPTGTPGTPGRDAVTPPQGPITTQPITLIPSWPAPYDAPHPPYTPPWAGNVPTPIIRPAPVTNVIPNVVGDGLPAHTYTISSGPVVSPPSQYIPTQGQAAQAPAGYVNIGGQLVRLNPA